MDGIENLPNNLPFTTYIGCGRQSTPSLFVIFVVKKSQ